MSTNTHTIPDWAIRAANDALAEFRWFNEPMWAQIIAKAIHDAVMAERERCAGLAEYFAQACVCADWPDDARGASYYACGDVASAIRNDTPPKQPSLPTSDDDLPF
ncbi:hypothetical protein AKG11_31075 [Shinella sp. SUS2]|uniref:hypothetical protein n=1 Tax=unclassified Shinella TaxID=2643062 RepID=UPI000681F6DF|nr:MULTISPECIES: hypothetical protein [unclassified Shinella]KNY13114.1 hypothetical protein AKG11_31075 [Shinella sp. SUS2]KOC71899.1 hypothetical protein AKG10_30495 [Shinella sp. GWS1]